MERTLAFVAVEGDGGITEGSSSVFEEKRDMERLSREGDCWS